MAEVKFEVPDEVKEVMQKSPNIDWSKVIKAAVLEKSKQLEFLKDFTSDSEMTEEDALEMGKEVNRKASEKYKS